MSRPSPVDLVHTYSSIGIDYNDIYIFDCVAWPGQAMPRGRLPASLLGHSVRMSTSSVCHHHHRSGRLRRLLPSSLHLARTWSVQPIMHDPPGSRDVHRRVLRASSPSNRAAGLLPVASSGCSTAARVSASPLHLHHRPLCIDDCTAHSLLRHPSAQGLRPADWVFVIELPLPAPSLSHARRSHPSHRR